MIVLIYPSSVERIFQVLSVSDLSVKASLECIEGPVGSVLVVGHGLANVVKLNLYFGHGLVQVRCLLCSLQSDSARSLLKQRLVGLTAVDDGVSTKSNEADIALTRVRHDHAPLLSCIGPRLSIRVLCLYQLPFSRCVQGLAPLGNDAAVRLHEGNFQRTSRQGNHPHTHVKAVCHLLSLGIALVLLIVRSILLVGAVGCDVSEVLIDTHTKKMQHLHACIFCHLCCQAVLIGQHRTIHHQWSTIAGVDYLLCQVRRRSTATNTAFLPSLHIAGKESVGEEIIFLADIICSFRVNTSQTFPRNLKT